MYHGDDDSHHGAAYLLYGPVNEDMSLAAADAFFAGESPGDEAGYSVTSARDVDGDGLDDILIGAWRNDASAYEAGAAYLLLAGH